MKITNKLNLPVSFVEFVKSGNKGYKPSRYSVTELLLPVREIILNRKHDSEIEEDVADCIPALFGTAVHGVLENNTPTIAGLYSEEPISHDFMGVTISGRMDLLNINELSIEDYKTCSVSKVMKADFEDWRMQGLMYANLVFKEKGIILRHLKFYALMKDWSKIKSATSANYPSSAIYVWEYDIQDSDYDFIDVWMRQRLSQISDALETGVLPECTDEERWYTGTTYAVYKNPDDKRAASVCDTEEEAQGYLANKLNGSGVIVKRLGEYLKCKYYCNCCKFCDKGE